MDGGQTNSDLNDESGDVVSDRHVVVDDDKSQVDTPNSQRHPATTQTTLLNLSSLILLTYM